MYIIMLVEWFVLTEIKIIIIIIIIIEFVFAAGSGAMCQGPNVCSSAGCRGLYL